MMIEEKYLKILIDFFVKNRPKSRSIDSGVFPIHPENRSRFVLHAKHYIDNIQDYDQYPAIELNEDNTKMRILTFRFDGN